MKKKEKDLITNIGKCIMNMRNLRGLSQSALAEGICDVLTIDNIETGRLENIDLVMINSLCLKLNIGIDFLFSLVQESEELSYEKQKYIYMNVSHDKSKELLSYCQSKLTSRDSMVQDYRAYILGHCSIIDAKYEEALEIFELRLEKFDFSKLTTFSKILLLEGWLQVSMSTKLMLLKDKQFIVQIINHIYNSLKVFTHINDYIRYHIILHLSFCYMFIGMKRMSMLYFEEVNEAMNKLVLIDLIPDLDIIKILLLRINNEFDDELVKNTLLLLMMNGLEEKSQEFKKYLLEINYSQSNIN